MLEINNFGLHESEGVIHLVQSKISNIVGLDNPKIKMKKNFHCPHNIDLDREKPSIKIPEKDQLFQVLRPVPKTEPYVYFIEKSSKVNKLIYYMTQMYCPTKACVKPIWAVETKDLADDLYRSNIMTYIFTDIDRMDHKLKRLANLGMYSPAKVLFIGDSDVPIKEPIKKIKTKIPMNQHIESIDLWKDIGAQTIKDYMKLCQKV